MRVLLVYDDAFVREIVSDTLREMGLAIVEAPRGDLAIQMLRAAPAEFDALVTDLVLPGNANGADVAATMKALRPEAPIVLVSGSTDALYENATPGVLTLAKPFFAADLVRLLNSTARGSLD